MADITNPEVVKWCNEVVCPLADLLGSNFLNARRAQETYNAFPALGALLIANPGGKIVDGSAQDGRHTITTDDVLNIVTRANEVVTDYTALSNAKLNTVIKVAVNMR